MKNKIGAKKIVADARCYYGSRPNALRRIYEQGIKSYLTGVEKFWKEFDFKMRYDPVLSKGSPHIKCCLRYFSSVERQVLALGEFAEKKKEVVAKLDSLENQINEGGLVDLLELVFLAQEATRRINRLAKNDPEYVSIAAQKISEWPVLFSRKTFCANEVKELAGKIRLDSAIPEILRQALFVATEDECSKFWAIKLFQSITSARVLYRVERPLENTWDIQTVSVGQNLIFRLGKSGVEQFKDRVIKLPPMAKNNFPAWWSLAEDLLDAVSKDRPWELKELKKYSQSSRANESMAGKNQKLDGVKRSDVKKAVRSAFKSLFNQCCDLRIAQADK